MEEVANSESLSLILNAPMVTLTHSMMASPLVKRLFFCKGNPWVLWKLHDHTPCQRGKPKKWIINKKYNGGTSPGRGENQREKSKVPHCQQAILYYARLWSGPSPSTHQPCTTWIYDWSWILWLTLDPGSKHGVEFGTEVEQSSNLESRDEWSSNLEVE